MNKFKQIALLSASLLTVSAVSPVVAFGNTVQTQSDFNLEKNDYFTLSHTQIQEFDKYVTLNSETLEFVIIDGAELELNDKEYALLQERLYETNATLSSINLGVNETAILTDETVVISQYTQPLEDGYATYSRFKEGINRLEVHWWGYRIFLSKTTLHYIGGGLTLGGIWIPEPLISKIAASAGVIISFAPGGIVFNTNFTFRNYWGVSFQ